MAAACAPISIIIGFKIQNKARQQDIKRLDAELED